MIPYTSPPRDLLPVPGGKIASFETGGPNFDAEIVRSFGSEWQKFSTFSEDAIETAAAEYFDLIPDAELRRIDHALDVGCGSGRWSRFLSKRVGFVESMDPSEAVFSARRLNEDRPNVRVTRASIDGIPFPDGAFDLAICLGVVHHLPDPALAVGKIVRKIRAGGSLLLYVYYSLEQRGSRYRALFRAADWVRRLISSLPQGPKHIACDAIAFLVYVPLVALSRMATALGNPIADRLPLAYYRNKSLKEIRTDALDRFGTAVERRFSRSELVSMMEAAGLTDVRVSERAPFWHAIGRKGGVPTR